MDRYLLVAGFGAAGAASRYAIDTWVGTTQAGDFPWGTMTVNLLGAFALGVLVALTTERMIDNENLRIAIGVGFLGSFTTFSTYAVQTVKLAEESAWGYAFLNSFGMLSAGLLLALAGLALGRSL